jgi:hypothetical protein
MVMPAPGQEVVVVGKIVNRLGTIRSVALQVFTNPADIQKILAQDSKNRSSEKPSPSARTNVLFSFKALRPLQLRFTN